MPVSVQDWLRLLRRRSLGRPSNVFFPDDFQCIGDIDPNTHPVFLAFSEADHFRSTYSSMIPEQVYLEHVRSHLLSAVDAIRNRSRFSFRRRDPLGIEFLQTDAMELSAGATLEHDGHATIEISLGSYLALIDAALRAVSAEGFFNPHPSDPDGNINWKGSRCREPVRFSPPSARYFDYSPSVNPIPDDSAVGFLEQLEKLNKVGDQITPSYIGRYIRKMPIDKDRLRVATIMIDIALMWLYLHEESHCRLGHLHYQLANQEPGLSDAGCSLVETGLPQNSSLSREASRVFEWQADRHATEGVIDIYAKELWYRDALPSYAQANWVWYFRLIGSAIGLTVVLLDQARYVCGSSAAYPSPTVRLCGILRTAYGRFRDHLKRFPGRRKLTLYHDRDLLGLPGIHSSRYVRAFSGVLWDVNEIMEFVRNEERNFAYDKDPLLDESIWSPLVTAVAYYVNIFDLGSVSSDRRHAIESAVRSFLRRASDHYDIAIDELEITVEHATNVTNELDHLIALNDQKYWKLLKPFHVKTMPRFF